MGFMNQAKMKTTPSGLMLRWVVATTLIGWCAVASRDCLGAPSEGIALAIVYDTSGSMLEQVKDGSGNLSPKYRIASRALGSIIQRLEVVASGPAEVRRPLDCGLVVFVKDRPSLVVPFGKFDGLALQRWLKAFNRPEGSTPLGQAVEAAGEVVLASPLARKHVLIVTDGINTRGPDPAAVIPRLSVKATGLRSAIAYHFVAFDVDAKEFSRVKKLGATVVGAADERQLNSQLEFILQEKILLEEEDPPAVKNKKQ